MGHIVTCHTIIFESKNTECIVDHKITCTLYVAKIFLKFYLNTTIEGNVEQSQYLYVEVCNKHYVSMTKGICVVFGHQHLDPR
jgi:hypothetical protein